MRIVIFYQGLRKLLLLNSPNFFIRGAIDDTWGSWYTFKPSTLQNLAGEEIPFTENTPEL